MITTRTRRLLIATAVFSALASSASGADPGVGGTEPQARASDNTWTMLNAAIPAPDADENVPDAANQLFSYYTVSGATMRGRSSTSETSYAGAGCIYLTAGSGIGLIVNSDLPVPDGSLIKYLRIYYNDTNASNGVRALITRYRPGTEAADLTSVTSTAAFAGGYGTLLSPEITELVDGDQYAYTVIGWPDVAASTNQICGVRVAYYGPDFFANGFETPL